MTTEDSPHSDAIVDSKAETHHRSWNSNPSGGLGMQIVATVATLEECDPIELPPLFDAVDPEALDALFSDTDNGVKLVRVSYCGYVIDVTPSRFVVRAAN